MVFVKAVHAAQQLSNVELQVYDSWFNPLLQMQPELIPNGFVYLKTNAETCARRIEMRQRSEEAKIALEYLEELHSFHDKWLVDGGSLVPGNSHGRDIVLGNTQRATSSTLFPAGAEVLLALCSALLYPSSTTDSHSSLKCSWALHFPLGDTVKDGEDLHIYLNAACRRKWIGEPVWRFISRKGPLGIRHLAEVRTVVCAFAAFSHPNSWLACFWRLVSDLCTEIDFFLKHFRCNVTEHVILLPHLIAAHFLSVTAVIWTPRDMSAGIWLCRRCRACCKAIWCFWTVSACGPNAQWRQPPACTSCPRCTWTVWMT
jgi:hypothetical protein